MEYLIKDTQKNPKSAGWTPLLLLVNLAVTIGVAIPVGYCLGVVNTPAEFIQAWCVDALYLRYGVHISPSNLNVLWASIVSTFLIGGMLGSFVAASCSNKFGRKGCLLISACLLIVAGILFYFCRQINSVEMLLLGRLSAGVAAAFVFTAMPMYLMEIAPAELRSTVSVLTTIGVTGGISVAQICTFQQVFGTDEMWHYALSFYVLLVIACFSPSYWFPESPRWLYVVKENEEVAKYELRRLRGSDTEQRVLYEIEQMQESVKAGNTQKCTFGAVLKNPELLLPLVLVCSFQACQPLSGINAIFFYSLSMFKAAGFSTESATWMNFSAGLLNTFVACLSPILMNKFNRRPLMMISCLCCGIALLGMAFTLFYIDLAMWLAPASIACLLAFIIFFQFGLGPIPLFIGSELFEVTPRPVAMAMGSFFSWTGNFLVGMCFPLLQNVGGSFAFLPCALVCFYGFLLTWHYLPETRGREPEAIKPLMINGFKSKVKKFTVS